MQIVMYHAFCIVVRLYFPNYRNYELAPFGEFQVHVLPFFLIK